MKGRRKVHGHASSGELTETYVTWQNMNSRCLNPRNPAFKNYGARGITICERWRKFENFLSDMGERPVGLTLDRINNDGNYEPENCRWVTYRENRRNARHSKLTLDDVENIRALSVIFSQNWIADLFGVDQALIWRIIHGKVWQ